MPTDERIERIRVALEADEATDALADLASLAEDVAALVEAAERVGTRRLAGFHLDMARMDLYTALARFGPQQQEDEVMSETRIMVCPVCGCSTTTECIGSVFCGPHGYGVRATPAVQMREAPVPTPAPLSVVREAVLEMTDLDGSASGRALDALDAAEAEMERLRDAFGAPGNATVDHMIEARRSEHVLSMRSLKILRARVAALEARAERVEKAARESSDAFDKIKDVCRLPMTLFRAHVAVQDAYRIADDALELMHAPGSDRSRALRAARAARSTEAGDARPI